MKFDTESSEVLEVNTESSILVILDYYTIT